MPLSGPVVKDRHGNAADSASRTVAAADVEVATKPDAPADLEAMRGDDEVTLAWTVPADNRRPITKHQVRRRDGSGA